MSRLLGAIDGLARSNKPSLSEREAVSLGARSRVAIFPWAGNFCALGRAQKFTLIIAVSRILNKRKISLHRQKSLVRNLEVWKFRSLVFTYKNIKKLILLFYYIPNPKYLNI